MILKFKSLNFEPDRFLDLLVKGLIPSGECLAVTKLSSSLDSKGFNLTPYTGLFWILTRFPFYQYVLQVLDLPPFTII